MKESAKTTRSRAKIKVEENLERDKDDGFYLFEWGRKAGAQR